MENRVVITGLGIWSSLGTSLGEVTESLREGRSGIGLDPERRELGYISALTGIVKRPELKGALDRRKRLCLPQQGEYAYMATAEAMRNAGMDEAFLAANEVGIIYGNDSSAAPVIEGIDIIRAKRNTAMVGSGNIFQSMNSTVTMNLSVIFNLRGVNLTLSAACASGSHAIGMGYLMIRQGLQERVVCGGAQEVNLYSVGSFDGLGAFSKRESDPAAASRPFDKDRDGLVPSGGAATVILESYDSAVRRGAAILGEVAGYGFSSNGEHISVPNVDGPRRSLLRCLADAGMQPEEIPYVNAHATSTPLGDYNEALAIDEVRREQALRRLDQVDDRPRNVDGGSQRNRLLDADDGARIHRPEHQFRAGRRSHLEAQHPRPQGGPRLRPLSVKLVRIRRNQLDPHYQEMQINPTQTMTQQELIEKINTVLADEFEVEQEVITPDAPLLETLDLDSLDLVDVVVLVDKNFGVTLTGPDFKELKTFQDFYDLIISRTNGN